MEVVAVGNELETDQLEGRCFVAEYSRRLKQQELLKSGLFGSSGWVAGVAVVGVVVWMGFVASFGSQNACETD